MDTIYAEATPLGRGGISVVRLSGPEAHGIGEAIAGPLPEARRAELRLLKDSELIDSGLVIRFDEGASFTGEPVVEFHLHGAPVIVRRLEAALRSRGARLAEAGEFTRRALLNGSLALSEVEALSDLLSAESEAQRQQAMKIVSGDLVRWTGMLRDHLIRAGALIEASLDFADEEVPEEVPAEVFELLAQVRRDIKVAIAGYPAAERLRAGFEVAIVGPPNAGKSSLLNRIAQRELALVSEVAGTTRDVIELHTELGGLAVTFLDTAGLRETLDMVEGMGVERALARASAADIRVHLSEEGKPVPDLYRDGDLVLQTKADLGGAGISAATGAGVREMLDEIRSRLAGQVAGAGLVTRQRQAQALEDAAAVLDVGPDQPAELLAEAVRSASYRLGEVVGRIAPDDYLDEIFSRFCIGK
ncbi:tRNA uridine-5-carboxymethylaminomethyl(34) synthesis GTPase MnmE [Paracoccus chinensis]|uniref:tRNA modification GTPase MnmE n=1 Tax=Paracoccus chinensis TaxID=525640 RepID=A0A1G9K8J0_9RHOB|nr:tRNA uridine-5-carboxymethylaminomethyl(34) synthesis GTPase MnmE [Paracoccus chinensis]SDL45959.1 tRNA modification GTPase [Paracoccus chinensis]